MLLRLSLALLVGLVNAARKIQNKGGTIAFEEAWTIPALLAQTNNVVPPLGQTLAEFQANVQDIHNQRLADMNANHIDFMILSCASPCIQGISDPDTAQNMSITVNNMLAASISNATERFGAFASLAMHDPSTAAAELNRTVTELGFLGALLNDYQQSGADNATLLYYDQPEYDVFWSMVQALDVPVYLHPRTPIAQIITLEWAHCHFLNGPPQEFATTLSTHVLGITINGVFDRFPNLKIVVGHLGERIPSDLFRIDEQLDRARSSGLPMLKNVTDYWQTNLLETTSGNFNTPLLKFHIDTIGLDRILFSIDYPYVSIPEGAEWFAGLDLPPPEKALLGRTAAEKLFKLE